MNATLFPCNFKVPCEIYGCRSMASWYVGREDGPLNCTFKLCDGCATHLVSNVPNELVNDITEDVAAEKKPATKKNSQTKQVE